MQYLWMAIITLVIVQTSVFCTTIYLHRTLERFGLARVNHLPIARAA